MASPRGIKDNPLLKPSSIFLIALSLSIGWGIRGDFGHESGAWIPGALAAMAICILSRRDDWRRRVGYCGFFGGLGWGFGGSIAYMTTMSYAASGELPSIWYGYGAVFLVGGLWAGIGGAGTALPLCIDRDRLTRLFVPACFVLAAIWLADIVDEPLAKYLSTKAAAFTEGVMSRQKSPLYWFDSDWLSALFALAGVCLYDVWQRRLAKGAQLVLFGALGAALGYLVQQAIISSGLSASIADVLVVPQGDLTAINPETHHSYDPANLLSNWPQFMVDFHQYLGVGLGLILGLAIYFWLYGRWKNDSGLFLAMAVGWWLAFLIMPVFLSIPFRNYGGFRLTPPRGDNWAGTLGVFIGASVYAWRNGMAPVTYAAAKNFILGGIAFPTVHFLRAMILIPGHVDLHNGVVPAPWKHYHSANWHSVLEQSQGFALGIATAVTFASLWPKLNPVRDDPPVRRWTDVVSIAFVVFGLTWFNVFKNVEEWTRKGLHLVPAHMKAPLIESIDLSAAAWFSVAWWAIALAFVALLIVHVRRGLPIVPSTWLGRGQIVYFLLMWIMVIANFEHSLGAGFHEQRLVTEWVIIMNASLATFLVNVLPKSSVTVSVSEPPGYRSLLVRTWMFGLISAAVLMSMYALVNYSVYGKAKINMPNIRWGPRADWRNRPLLKNKPHR